jgi:hypothetical protein
MTPIDLNEVANAVSSAARILMMKGIRLLYFVVDTTCR